MTKNELKLLAGFYENELTNKFLHFWLPRCVDSENGGFVNCFDNSGENLISRDKYTWSQGRFVWFFSKLASMEAPIFSAAERANFLALAKHGADFLMRYCLMGEDDWRCVFLMEADGTPKYVDGFDRLDMSVSADCFVVAGLAKYAEISGDMDAYNFAKCLYESVVDRIARNDFQSLPYPLSKQFRSHGIPMIMCSVARDVYFAALKLEEGYAETVKAQMAGYSADVLDHFVDENYLLHEIITDDNKFFNKKLGMHINPGHTIEDVWFHLDAIDVMDCPEWEARRPFVHKVALKALETGWDEEFGGILHYASLTGGMPTGDNSGLEDEPMSQQLSGWGDKLWWLHSEALYSTLRCYFESGNEEFKAWHDKVFDYTYETFPNTDPEIREWKQIRERDGKAAEKVVALPVKDPYHIIRNLILIIELLYAQLEKN